MNTIFILFLAILLVSIWRRYYLKSIRLQFKYALYTLRDQLRRDAVVGNINKKSDAFSYLDFLLSKSIKQSYSLTILNVFFLYTRYKPNQKFDQFRKDLEYQESQNPYFKEMIIKYNDTVIKYLTNQHIVSWKFIYRPALVGFGALAFVNEFVKNMVNGLHVYPETSNPKIFSH